MGKAQYIQRELPIDELISYSYNDQSFEDYKGDQDSDELDLPSLNSYHHHHNAENFSYSSEESEEEESHSS